MRHSYTWLISTQKPPKKKKTSVTKALGVDKSRKAGEAEAREKGPQQSTSWECRKRKHSGL